MNQYRLIVFENEFLGVCVWASFFPFSNDREFFQILVKCCFIFDFPDNEFRLDPTFSLSVQHVNYYLVVRWWNHIWSISMLQTASKSCFIFIVCLTYSVRGGRGISIKIMCNLTYKMTTITIIIIIIKL